MAATNPLKILQEIVGLCGLHVLDVGCGDGSLLRAMAEAGAHVTGIECSPCQLEKARAGPRVADEQILEGCAQRLPVVDHSFDIVVFMHTLHHVPVEKQDIALTEAARVLRPGGLVYVQEPLAEGALYEVSRYVEDERDVRARAYEAVKRVPQQCLREEGERFSTLLVREKSFESFRERILAMGSEREANFAQHETILSRLFHARAVQDPDGFCFEQPVRVNLLRKPT